MTPNTTARIAIGTILVLITCLTPIVACLFYYSRSNARRRAEHPPVVWGASPRHSELPPPPSRLARSRAAAVDATVFGTGAQLPGAVIPLQNLSHVHLHPGRGRRQPRWAPYARMRERSPSASPSASLPSLTSSSTLASEPVWAV